MYKFIVDNKEFTNVISFTIVQTFNTIASVFKLTTNKKIYDNIMSMPDIKIYRDNSLIFTGVIMAPSLSSSAESESIEYVGYSSTGVLENSNVHPDNYPLQFDNMSLIQITEKLIDPFGLSFTWQGDILEELNKIYKKTFIEPTQTIKDYLTRLVSQRNVYMTNNTSGELVYMRYNPDTYRPVAFYEEGKEGLKKVTVTINPQNMHSSITVLKQATKSSPNTGQYTINNPYIDRFMPITQIACAGDNFDIEKAARTMLSQDLRQIRFTLEVTKFTEVGRTIELYIPSFGSGFEKKLELFVEECTFNVSAEESENIVLTCVFPDVYTNKTISNDFSN